MIKVQPVVMQIASDRVKKGYKPLHPLQNRSGRRSDHIDTIHKTTFNKMKDLQKIHPEFIDFKYELRNSQNETMWVLVGYLESPNDWNYYEYTNPNGQIMTIWTLGVRELLIEIEGIKRALKNNRLKESDLLAEKQDLENQLKVFRFLYDIKNSGIELLP